MARNQFTLKTLISVTIVSYFAYALYWFVKTIPWFVHISQGPEYYSAPTGLIYTNAYSLLTGYITDYSAFFGLTIRVIDASYALLAALLTLKNKTNPVTRDVEIITKTNQNTSPRPKFMEFSMIRS
jgi:hypothetical protein